jgi:nuclear pore complex protein Nup155
MLISSQNRSDFSSYDDSEDTIIAIGLAKPKPGKCFRCAIEFTILTRLFWLGVFIDSVQHVLVICMPFSVRVVGLTLSPSPPSGPSKPPGKPTPTIYLTDLTAQTSGAFLRVICGTPEGRIFLGGDDGALYELDYQAEEGWFSKKCSLTKLTSSTTMPSVSTFFSKGSSAAGDHIERIASDPTRRLIYVLHKSNAIEVFHLGSDGKGKATRVARNASIGTQAISMVAPTPALDNSTFKIANIIALGTDESRSIGLVAITSTGISTAMSECYPAWTTAKENFSSQLSDFTLHYSTVGLGDIMILLLFPLPSLLHTSAFLPLRSKRHRPECHSIAKTSRCYIHRRHHLQVS